jgi:hypothetical protein
MPRDRLTAAIPHRTVVQHALLSLALLQNRLAASAAKYEAEERAAGNWPAADFYAAEVRRLQAEADENVRMARAHTEEVSA